MLSDCNGSCWRHLSNNAYGIRNESHSVSVVRIDGRLRNIVSDARDWSDPGRSVQRSCHRRWPISTVNRSCRIPAASKYSPTVPLSMVRQSNSTLSAPMPAPGAATGTESRVEARACPVKRRRPPLRFCRAAGLPAQYKSRVFTETLRPAACDTVNRQGANLDIHSRSHQRRGNHSTMTALDVRYGAVSGGPPSRRYPNTFPDLIPGGGG